MGAAGFKGSWPPVFPDNGGMLRKTTVCYRSVILMISSLA